MGFLLLFYSPGAQAICKCMPQMPWKVLQWSNKLDPGPHPPSLPSHCWNALMIWHSLATLPSFMLLTLWSMILSMNPLVKFALQVNISLSPMRICAQSNPALTDWKGASIFINYCQNLVLMVHWYRGEKASGKFFIVKYSIAVKPCSKCIFIHYCHNLSFPIKKI